MNAIDKAPVKCTAAILANVGCSTGCKKHKYCEEYKDFLSWKKTAK